MRGLFFVLTVFLSVLARADFDQAVFRAGTDDPIQSDIDFFTNSTRRSGTAFEERAMVRVSFNEWRCGGFFVQNSANRLYVMSARHCAQYEFRKNCAAGAVRLATSSGVQGQCVRVLASSDSYDIVLFEAKFSDDNRVRNESRFLRPLSVRPPFGTRVFLQGYPGDKMAQGRFTISENCWIARPNPILTSDLTEAELAAISAENMSRNEPQRGKDLRSRLVAPTLAMNCDVYGGNSGGPAIIQGTNIVVGLPSSYFAGLYREMGPEKTSPLDAVADFLQAHSSQIVNLGLSLATSSSSGNPIHEI